MTAFEFYFKGLIFHNRNFDKTIFFIYIVFSKEKNAKKY